MPGFPPGVPLPSRERRGAGAKVVDLSFDGSTPHPAYRVKVLLKGELWEGTIDASTGVPSASGQQRLYPGWARRTRRHWPPSPQPASIFPRRSPLPNKYGSGKAVSAGLQHNGAKLVLLVVVVSEGSLKEVSVEPPEKRSRQRKASAREKKWKRPSSGGTSRAAFA